MMRTDTGHEVPAFLWAKGGHPFYETARRQVRRTRADHAYSMARGGYAARSAPRGMQVHVRVHVHVRAVRLSRTTTARLSYGSTMYRV